MLATGFWLAKSWRKSGVRILGAAIALLGTAPVLLWLSFLYWALFLSDG